MEEAEEVVVAVVVEDGKNILHKISKIFSSKGLGGWGLGFSNH